MVTKQKALPYKKGDKVLYIGLAYGYNLTQATVTQVRNDQGIVHTQSLDQHGNIWKRKFGREPGSFQQDPYPLWQLRLQSDKDNMANLQKRVRNAKKQYLAYGATRDEVYNEVTRDAREWERRERERRQHEVPDQFQYIERVASRMGFKRGGSK